MKTEHSLITLVFLLILFASIIGTALATTETLTVPPHQEITRTLSLREGDRVSGSISVIGGDENDIDFLVVDPDGIIVLQVERLTHKDFSFNAEKSGTYVLRFDNSFSLLASKQVTLNYDIKHYIMGIPQEQFFLLVIVAVIVIAIIVFAASGSLRTV
ncbi:MAG: emp24/gp25L/p24 family protein [Thermoproteota archaeon]|nr:emp24/gp25L/p24 family protein [Thermoproteota archaeon]